MKARLFGAVSLLLAGAVTPAWAADDTVFLSTQLRPIEEAQKMRDVILKDYKGKVDYVPEQPAELAGAHPGRAAGRHAHDQPDRRAAWRAAAVAADQRAWSPVDDLAAQLKDRGFPAGPDESGQVRRRASDVHPLDAGDVFHGRQQAGAAVPAGGCGHQRADLRAAGRLGEGHAGEDGTADAGLSGRPFRD